MDDIVAKILETLRPHARQVTTHAVGLAERVEALLQLQHKARHGVLLPDFGAMTLHLCVATFRMPFQDSPCKVQLGLAWQSACLAMSHTLAEQQPFSCQEAGDERGGLLRTRLVWRHRRQWE